MLTTMLYRPVGPVELELLRANHFTAWPPRLPEQPFFYPVTNLEYAREITVKWNVPQFGAGFVTRFQVSSEYLSQFPVQTVGAERHTEWWVPSEQLQEFNRHLVGPIELIESYPA